MTKYIFYTAANLIVFLLFIALIATPFYFAKNTSNIAGVKSQANYLLISQLDNFPNISSLQTGTTYEITINKLPKPTLFTEIFIINNPTSTYKSYEIKSRGAEVFFGNSQQDIKTTLTMPPNASVPISVIDQSNKPQANISFEIIVR